MYREHAPMLLRLNVHYFQFHDPVVKSSEQKLMTTDASIQFKLEVALTLTSTAVAQKGDLETLPMSRQVKL